MNISLSTAKHAFRLYSHDGVEKKIIRHNVTSYLRALSIMGEKYILAKPIVLKRLDNKPVLGN